MEMSSREMKLQSVLESGRRINEIKDTDMLLKQILTEARHIVNADAGSIYVVGDKEQPRSSSATRDGAFFLKIDSSVYSLSIEERKEYFRSKLLSIKYAQNDTTQQDGYKNFSFNISDTSISGYSILSGEILNIEDAYDIPSDAPYSFDKKTDIQMNYVTRSMLTIPLINSNDRPLGVLQIINAQDSDGNVISFDDDAILFIKYFADSATQALEHSYLTNSMIMRMQKMAEYRDPKETFHHVQRVAEFSDVIYVNWAKRNGVPVEKMERYRDLLRIAAKCHDLGKVGVSDIILKKPGPGRFTDDERSTMKGHTCIGALLFSDMESEIDSLSRDVALRHHEWWDGSENGYPGDFDFRGYVTGEPIPKSRPLKGEEIPFAARIVAIADVFDALSHRRVYKEAWSVDDAFIEIQQLSGVQFDPELVMCFLSEREKVCAINRMWESTVDD